MPVLPAEPDLFPPLLFEEAERADGEGRCWWVLHTRPRQEKSLARQLLRAEVPFYLPTVPRRLKASGRSLTSFVPLFPGYAFLYGRPADRLAALTTNRVVRTLEVADQQALWHDLRQVQRLIASGAPVLPESRLAPGMAVEIQSGPLMGLKGRIIRNASGRRFVVQVDFIQQGASVELDDFTLLKSE